MASSKHPQRFRRVGEYSWDQLLKDLRDLDSEVGSISGLKGDQGDVGPPGVKGNDGSPGTNGENGNAGVNGENGLSAYEIAVQDGFIGTEEEWLLSLSANNPNDYGLVNLDYRSVSETVNFSDDFGSII